VKAEAVVVGQPGTVAPGYRAAVTGPWTRLLTVTSVVISGVRPTAPFHVNTGLTVGTSPDVHGEFPLVAPSVVAGSPRCNGFEQLDPLAQPGYGVLKIFGNWVDGRPAATSAKPDRGPNENINVCVPSASVMKPSPPEICWHLMAPFTVLAVGTTKPPLVPAGGVLGTINCVGPL